MGTVNSLNAHARVTYDDSTKVTQLIRYDNLLYRADLQPLSEDTALAKIKTSNNLTILSNNQYIITDTQILDFSDEEDIESAISEYVNSIVVKTVNFEGDDLQTIFYVVGSGKNVYSISRVLHYLNSTIDWVGGTLFETNNRVSVNLVGVGYGENKTIGCLNIAFYPPEGSDTIEEGVFTLLGKETNDKIEGGFRYFLVSIHVMNFESEPTSIADEAEITGSMGNLYQYKMSGDTDQFVFDEYADIGEVADRSSKALSKLPEACDSKFIYVYLPYMDIDLSADDNVFRSKSYWLILIVRRIYYFELDTTTNEYSKKVSEGYERVFYLNIT